MFKPSIRKSNRTNRLTVTRSRPAPIFGLNARDALSDMDPRDAVTLTNWFPRTSDVRLRKGYSSYATGLGSYVESLMAFSYGTTNKLYGAVGGSIYDVSSSGAVGAAVVTGKTNARWQHIVMGNGTSQVLMLFNGADVPLNFDGTTWATTPAITGVTAANLITANVFKHRVFAIEKNSMNAWYLPTDSIGGAANKLDFAFIFKLGGYLTAMGTWTLDAGIGVDDHAVFISSEGEIAVYKGTDPSSANTWALVGVYRTAKPLGRRCFMKLGGDLVLITADGFLPLSKALVSDRVNAKYALSDKIVNAVTTDAASYGASFGWQGTLYPEGLMVLFNVPTAENSTAIQYVMNTATGAWCRFEGWNANCFEVYNDELYFGGNGTVWKAWDGLSDNDTNITGDVKTAFDYFDQHSQSKRFTMVRPLIATDGAVNPAMEINVDFEDRVPTGTASFSAVTGATWDVSAWDVSDWAASAAVNKQWFSAQGVGNCAALRMRVGCKGIDVYLNAVDYMYEPGGAI